MRKLTALLLAGLLCLSLCACGEEPETPVTESPDVEVTVTPVKEKGFALAYDPGASLHPITGDSQVNQMLTALIYEGLYALDDTFAPQPVLAEMAEMDETALIWTITLKSGILFSDGTPLEADHVVSSLNTARKSGLYASRLSGIVSVRARENQVVITLSSPHGALPSLLDIPIVLETGEGEAPLGTGRYRYARDGEKLYLLANYNREGSLPYDTISLSPVTAVDERISAFDSGAVSAVITDFLSPYSLNYACDYEVWDYDTTDLLYVGFKTVDSLCADAFVRKAFACAFDRAALVSDIMSGHGDPATLPVSSLHTDWYEPAAEALEYDLEQAAELLSQGGYIRSEEDGLWYRGRSPLAVTLLVNSDNPTKAAMADRLAEALMELGVTVTVSKQPWKDYVAALEKGNFDLYLGEVRLTADFDVTELLAGSLNYGGYDVTPLAQRLAEWKQSSGLTRHWRAGAFWDVFVEDVPFAPLCFKQESMLVRWDAGVRPTPIRTDPFLGMESWLRTTE